MRMNATVLDIPPVVGKPPDLYAPIAADLEDVERVLARELRSRYPAVTEVVQHTRLYRGKRLRPVLLLLVARACGRLTPAHPVLGAVVEMIHTATLVHDDVLDGAEMRRHVPTVNARWGTQASVLLGDFLFTHAFHLAATLDDVRACRIIGQATNRVCEGELCQELAQGKLDLTEAEYLDVIDGKTAELIACCCQLGSLFAGMSPDVVASLTRYGRCLGLAFQIADDVLDLVGEEQTTGKSLGTDLEQQKLTLPVIHLLATGGPGQVEVAREILRHPSADQRRALLPLLTETESLGYARRRALEYTASARAELACLPPSPARGILEAISYKVVDRDH
jgi:octaprenyl-diphosphate synthase